MKSQYSIYTAILISSGLIGYFIGISSNQTVSNLDHPHIELTDTEHTCSMHPNVRQKGPGSCPICGMDLIPVEIETNTDKSPLVIKMSPTAMQLANVQTAIVESKHPIKQLQLFGKVQADERSVSSQTSHISGRVEKLLVTYTGEYITKGQVIAYVYSPELVTAQEELFIAYSIRESQPSLFQAAKHKLKNWKLTNEQIDGILKSGRPNESFPILSDLNGRVVSKNVKLGDHIHQGTSLFEVADFSKVWVLFDVYESDLTWVKNGNKIEYTVQSLPGEIFHGEVSFIDPVIDAKTRVAKARVISDNKNGRLKPEMFVSGKLISPLDLSSEAITIPKTAVMWTGERSVVYVKSTAFEEINFLMRKVRLGPDLGESYVILDGLEKGEEIAINGTFSIDAAAQLAGKPSMMNPKGLNNSADHIHVKMEP